MRERWQVWHAPQMKRVILPVLVMAALTGTGCGKKKPPALHNQQSAQQLKSAMWAISADTSTLVELLAVDKPDSKTLEQARRLVDNIGARGAALQAAPESKSHPLLGPGLPRFLEEVAVARAALDRTPPQTLAARTLGESCRTCHAVASLPRMNEAMRLAVRSDP